MPPRPPPRFRKPCGFTLLEGLIAIALLVVLCLLSMVGIEKIRGQSKQVGCLANLREIGRANLAYASEHGGRIASQGGPDGTNTDWRRALRPYLMENWNRNVECPAFLCPGDPDLGKRGGNVAVMMNRQQWRSYSVNIYTKNQNYEGIEPGKPKRIHEVPAPGGTIYLIDAAWWKRDTNYIESHIAGSMATLPMEWHGGRANAVFLDGHCESLEIASLFPGQPNHGAFQGTR